MNIWEKTLGFFNPYIKSEVLVHSGFDGFFFNLSEENPNHTFKKFHVYVEYAQRCSHLLSK